MYIVAGPVNFEFPLWVYILYFAVLFMYLYLICGTLYVLFKAIKSVYKRNKKTYNENIAPKDATPVSKGTTQKVLDYSSSLFIDGVISSIIVAAIVVPLYVENWETSTLVYSVAFGCFIAFTLRLFVRILKRRTIGDALLHIAKQTDEERYRMIIIDLCVLTLISWLSFAASSSV